MEFLGTNLEFLGLARKLKTEGSTRSNSNASTFLASWHGGFEALATDELRGDDGFESHGPKGAGFEALTTRARKQVGVLEVDDHMKRSPMCYKIEENEAKTPEVTMGEFNYARNPYARDGFDFLVPVDKDMKLNFTMAKLIQDFVKPVVYCAWKLLKSLKAGCLYSWKVILDDMAANSRMFNSSSYMVLQQEFEHQCIQWLNMLMQTDFLFWFTNLCTAIWSRTGYTGLWLSWLLSLGVIWTSSHLSWHVRREKKSRFDKTKAARHRCKLKRQVQVLLFASVMMECHGMKGRGQSGAVTDGEFLDRMAQLAESAASAARAAETAIGLLSTASASASSSTGASSGTASTMQAGLTAASRVLRNPDVFDGADPHGFVSWKFIFTSWLTFAEPKFQQMLDKIEALETLPEMTGYSEEEQQFSSKLFAILTSYLRGRCLHLVRSGMHVRDGFRLWKELHREYLPSTRARSLAIAQALATYPSFPKEKSVLESVLSYEQLVQEFEKLSGTTYPAELKAATLIRCSESRLREHLQLTIKEDTTYAQIREALLSHEQVSKTWSQEAIMKSLTLKNEAAANPNGPAPMEVDRIEEKGKGKGKYKGKYKGGRSWWQNIPFGGRGNPKGKGRGNGRGGKSKGENKGKPFGKGKTKSKGKAGGKKGGLPDANQCRICFAYGHWSRDCPNRMVQQIENLHITPSVQQQQQQRQMSGSTAATAVMSMPSGSVGSNASTLNTAVRRIFHIGPPSSLAGSDVSTIRVIIQEVVDESQIGSCRSIIILDSGSDVSLLPISFSSDKLNTSAVRLQDCQGTSLSTIGQQNATLIVRDTMSGEEVELRHNFLVGNVRNCILSLGELYKSGWTVEQEHGKPVLCSPDRQVRVPVFFQRNSFAIEATVCRVSEIGQAQEACEVRAVIRLSPCFMSDRRYGVWDVENNHPFMKSLGSAFVDPRAVWSANFAFRTTLIQHVAEADEGWQVVELSQNYLEQEDPFGRIAEVPAGEQCIILTILADREETLSSFGSLIGGEEMLAPEACPFG